MSDHFHQGQRENLSEKDPQRTVLPEAAKLLGVPFHPRRIKPSPDVPFLACPGSAAGAAGRGCFATCPWDAVLLVPAPKLQATGSHLGADATRCNCSPAAPWGACWQTVPRCKHCIWGKGRGASRQTPLFTAAVWEQCSAQQGCRVQSPAENLHKQGVGWSSAVGLPAWSEPGAVPAGKTRATGMPSGRIWGCVAVGNVSRAKSLFSRLPLLLSWGEKVGARAAAARMPPPSNQEYARSDLDLSRQT